MVNVMTAKNKVATTVINGFLGSGKTTIISHLLESSKTAGINVVYIKNEIGESDLDASLMRGENIISKEILNGCICCTLVGPFIQAIEEVVNTYKPDRIIIESAGTADPAALALMVSDHPMLYRDGVISIIDVLNFEGYQDLSHVARRQAEMTDLIVLNKVELADLDQKKRVVGYIRELNEQSPIIEAPGGKIDKMLAFGISSLELEMDLVDAGSQSHAHHLEDDHIDAITVNFESACDEKQMLEILTQLPKSVIRVKGVVNFSESGRKIVNGIFKRIDLTPLPENFEYKSSHLICIGYHLETQKQEISQLLNQACPAN